MSKRQNRRGRRRFRFIDHETRDKYHGGPVSIVGPRGRYRTWIRSSGVRQHGPVRVIVKNGVPVGMGTATASGIKEDDPGHYEPWGGILGGPRCNPPTSSQTLYASSEDRTR